MTQQLVRGTPAGPLAAFADRLPPMIATEPTTAPPGASSTSSPSPSATPTPARPTTAPSRGSWAGASSAGSTGSPPSGPSTSRRTSSSSPSHDHRSGSTSLQSAGASTGWSPGGTLDTNPATSVQRPRHVVRVGRTPVLSDDQARTLLDSISIDKVAGLRDRALIATMLYTFGRVGAVIAMDVEDYRLSNHQRTFLLHEKGGKEHHVPAHHRLVEYLGEYMDATGLWHSPKSPLFQAVDITKSRLKGTRMNRQIVFQMVRRRARRAGLPPSINCHSFRATGITNYLSNGGSLEDARAIAAHESSQTTRLYDRTGDSITLDEIERIRF